MKMIKILLVFFFIIGSMNSVFAFKYCDEDKTLFYDAFLDGYITEMRKSVDKLNVDETKKEKFMYLLEKKINREYLVKSSWDCIQKYPISQIVSASVICTADWNKMQMQKNQELYKILK